MAADGRLAAKPPQRHHVALSIRLRLTLWYSLTLGVTLLLFASFVYVTLARNLSAEIDRSIADRSVEVNGSIRLENVPLRGPGVVLPRPDVYAAADIFVQISTLEGEVVTTSANLEGRPLPIDRIDLAAARSGTAHYETIQVGGERLRVLDSPLLVAGRPVGLLQVARALAPLEDTLNRLRLLLLAGIGLSLLFSAFVAWTLAQAALAPIDEVTRTAEQIGAARDFGRRVEHAGPPDEVGRLAATFNLMLGQLQAAYAELQAAYARVEDALASQRRFVADASHELRTPLTTIRGNAGLLQQVELSPADRQESLAQIAGEAERMSRLVSELLTLARADAGQRLAREPVALGSLLREVARQAALISQSVELRLGPLPEAEVEVLGDRDYLKQLLLILVENALKYTPAGGLVTLSLATGGGPAGAERSGSRVAELRVADTGVGIAPEDLPHVFERFFRADRARQAGGTGLGLAIARWIVEQHGGEVAVKSEVGRGSVFTVRLPLGGS